MNHMVLDGVYGSGIEVDLCYACHVLWLDKRESLQLSPRGILDLFGCPAGIQVVAACVQDDCFRGVGQHEAIEVVKDFIEPGSAEATVKDPVVGKVGIDIFPTPGVGSTNQ